jgi:Putative phage metallopeptidase
MAEGDKLQSYTQDEMDVALAALKATGDLKKAAHFSQVPIGLLRRWSIRKARKPQLPYVPGVRPAPPEELLDDDAPGFLFDAATAVEQWIRHTFLNEDSPLFNPDHEHLQDAVIGVLWTNCPNSRGGKMIAGTAERGGGGQGGKWQKARATLQLYEWFGGVPTFLITLDSLYSAHANDASFMALVEHEMYHCAHKRDEFDDPAYDDDGLPVFTLSGHDAEEFVGVVRRYGVGAAARGVAELVKAASLPASVAIADITAVCGTCKR